MLNQHSIENYSKKWCSGAFVVLKRKIFRKILIFSEKFHFSPKKIEQKSTEYLVLHGNMSYPVKRKKKRFFVFVNLSQNMLKKKL